MYQKKLPDEVRCPLEYGMRLFGGKWKPRILCVLSSNEPIRYSALKTELVDITDGVLSSTLRDLIASGLVTKQPAGGADAYVLTEYGRSAMPILRGLCVWAGKYYPEDNSSGLGQCLKCDFSPHHHRHHPAAPE